MSSRPPVPLFWGPAAPEPLVPKSAPEEGEAAASWPLLFPAPLPLFLVLVLFLFGLSAVVPPPCVGDPDFLLLLLSLLLVSRFFTFYHNDFDVV